MKVIVGAVSFQTLCLMFVLAKQSGDQESLNLL